MRLLKKNEPFPDVDGLLLQIGAEGLDGEVPDLGVDRVVVVQHHGNLVSRGGLGSARRRRSSCTKTQ